MMQKTIPPDQVDDYLKQGYDRVAGFVHRANEVAHLTTPAKLYRTLGLDYPGSPFRLDADTAYVLRWPAYHPSLYRIPFGGQNDVAMRAMEGWVIERAPFRGNGFAPSDSSDAIPEFKLDEIQLPHGSQLWQVRSDGTQTLVAVLDSDLPIWRRIGQGLVMRNGYVARWRGRDYEASPDGARVRLYQPEAGDGFEEVRPGRFVRVLPITEVEDLAYVRTTCSWKGEPFIVLAEHGTRLWVEHTGGKRPVAESMGLEEVDFGVYRGWAPTNEVTDLREHRARHVRWLETRSGVPSL